MIELPIKANHASAYLARPKTGTGPGILVLHAWWGLTDFFTEFCDRLASEGFLVLAPDLYHGATATTIEQAKRLRSKVNRQITRQEIITSLEYLKSSASPPGGKIGLVGFSLGAYYGLQFLEEQPDQVAAVVLFYGKKPGEYSGCQAAFLGHFAENDDFESLASVKGFEKQVRGAGHALDIYIYPGTGHWFFESDRPSAYHPEAAQLAWERTVAFFRTHLNA